MEALEPRALLATLVNSGTADDIIYNLPPTASNIFLEDDGTPGNNLVRLRSSSGTFDTTTFANPAGSLTINRGNTADTLTINNLTDLTSTLTLGKSGGEFTSITIAGTLTLGPSKSLSAFAKSEISLTNTASDITTSGTGSVTLTSLRTLTLLAGSSITTTNGDISLSANEQSARTSGAFEGLLISQADITTSGSGKIRIYGRGGDERATEYQHGINIESGTIRSTSTIGNAGTITLLGEGIGGTQDADGVLVHNINGLPSTIESVVGNIQITGTGGFGSTTFNRGVALLQQTQLRSLGTGLTAANININGVARAGTDFNEGVDVGGPNTNISVIDGYMFLNGEGAQSGKGQYNAGIRIRNGAQLTSTGLIEDSNGIILVGRGGTGTTIAQGIRIEDVDTDLSSVNGSIQIDGTATAAAGIFQDGIRLVDGANITTTGSGRLSINGSAAGAPTVGVALRLGGNSLSTISLTGGPNALHGDRIILDTTNFQLNAEDKIVSAGPLTEGTLVNIGSTVDTTANTFELSAAELSRFNVGQLDIGFYLSGPLTLSVPLTLSSSLSLYSGSSLTLNESITLAANQSFYARAGTTLNLPKATSKITTTGSGTIRLDTLRSIRLTAGSAIQSEDGEIELNGNWLNAPTAGDFDAIHIQDASITTTGAGNINLRGRGGDDASTDQHQGVHILGTVAANGTGSIAIQGVGGLGTEENNGVVVELATGQVLTKLGNMQIEGTGGAGTADHNRGVVVLNGAQIRSEGRGASTAKIFISGTGGTGTDQSYGLEVYGSGSLISTFDVDLDLRGQGGLQATGTTNAGLFIGGGGVITAPPTSTADISIQATGGGAGTADGNSNQGVRIADAGSKIETWTSGSVYIQGTGGTANVPSNTFSDGIRFRDGAQLLAHGTGPLTLIGRAGSNDRSQGVGLRVDGSITLKGLNNVFSLDSVVLEPNTASIVAANTSLTINTGLIGEGIDLGSTSDTANTLALSDAELDCIQASSLVLNASGDFTVTADITRPSAMNMAWFGKSITFATGSIDTAGGDLLLQVPPIFSGAVTVPHTGIDANLGTGTLRFASGTRLSFAINGKTPDTQYDQLKVVGNVELLNTYLALTGNYSPAIGDSFTLIDRTGNDGIGFFEDLPDPSIVNVATGPLTGKYLLSYHEGDGNEVVLSKVNPKPTFNLRLNTHSAPDEDPTTRGPASQHGATNFAQDIFVLPFPGFTPTFKLTTDKPELFNSTGQPKLDAVGSLTYTPRPNAFGTAKITVELQDGTGDVSNQATFTITITKTHKLHNAAEAGVRNGLDVTGSQRVQPDGVITAGDALAIVNYINAFGSGKIPANFQAGPPYCDVNGDDSVAADDVLKVINYLNSGQSGEGEATSASSIDPAAHDAALLTLQGTTDLFPATAKKRK